MQLLKAFALLSTVVLIIGGGTVFFHHVEGWSWLDSYFFTVVTLSTVGYGSIVPVTALGKIGTTVFIFLGLGIFAVAIQQFGAFAARKREEHTEWLVAQLGHGHHSRKAKEPHADNADDAPHHPMAPPPKDQT